MSDQRFPPGWNEERVKRLIAHNESSMEEKQVAEDEAAVFDPGKWERQFEADVAAGRLDWLIAETRKDRQEGRCTDR